MCPWAAARPRAARAASFARRVVSKPGQAPPPPTGTAAWLRIEARPCPPDPPAPSTPASLCRWRVAGCVGSRPALALPPLAGTAARPTSPSGALHIGVAVSLCVSGRVVSKPGQAPPPPPGTAARPANPSGGLHTGGTCVAWTSPARPCCQSHFVPSRRTLIAESTFNFACNSLTALSNHEFRLLELQRFQTLLKLLLIELHATFLRPGPAVTFRLRGQVLRLEVCLVPPVSAAPGVLRGVA